MPSALSRRQDLTDFIGFILLDNPKPMHPRWINLLRRPWGRLTAAFHFKTPPGEPMVERECLYKDREREIGWYWIGTG